ncbi:hypothetical protein, partial [Metallibacterium sp.]
MSRQYTFSLLATALLSLAPLVGAAPAPAASSAPPARASLRQFEHDVLSIVALRSEADRLAGAAVLARAVPDLPTVLTYQTFLARAKAAPGAGAAEQWEAVG